MSQNTSLENSHDMGSSGPYVKGLEGIIAAQTGLSHVDGEESQLYYRGIPIPELTGVSTFEETVFLLWYNRLPLKKELTEFKKALSSYRKVDSEVLNLIKNFPKQAHPMGVLRSMVSLLGLYEPDADKIDLEGNKKKAFRLTSALPTLITAHFRIRSGEDPIEPSEDLDHAANFYYMTHGKKPAPEMERALDAYMILLADHGLNASTFAARVTVSTQSDMYSGITSAVGTLKGDLHGSANQRAMEMLLDIGEPDRAEPYVRDLLKKKAKVMGFGHRIYKKKDPRAVAFREIARNMCEKFGEKKWVEISDRVEKIMWEEKKIPCNVDFYSASVLYILGFPVDFFTTVFAASRVAGWTAHVIEQLSDNRLIRPASTYIGPKDRHYQPIEKRK